MGGAQESLEHAEHVEHAIGHNKQIALLIAVIALFLALSETFGKSAQTSAISDNVEASNLYQMGPLLASVAAVCPGPLTFRFCRTRVVCS